MARTRLMRFLKRATREAAREERDVRPVSRREARRRRGKATAQSARRFSSDKTKPKTVSASTARMKAWPSGMEP